MNEFEEEKIKERTYFQIEKSTVKRRLLQGEIYEILKYDLPNCFEASNKSMFNLNLQKLENLMIHLEELEKEERNSINTVISPYSLSNGSVFYLAKMTEQENTPMSDEACYSKEGYVLTKYKKMFGKKDVIAIIRDDGTTYLSYDDNDKTKSIEFNRNKSIELSRDVWESTTLNYYDYLLCFSKNSNNKGNKIR